MKFDNLLKTTERNSGGHPLFLWVATDADVFIGYGAEAGELTEDDFDRLRSGEVIEISVQGGEYGIYLRYRSSSPSDQTFKSE